MDEHPQSSDRFLIYSKFPPDTTRVHHAALLIHGLFSFSYSWRYLAPLLIEMNLFDSVYVPDLYGWGYSDKPTSGTLKMCTDHLHALMQQLEANAMQWTLIAWSYGCAITLKTLELYGTRNIKAVVLISPVCTEDMSWMTSSMAHLTTWVPTNWIREAGHRFPLMGKLYMNLVFNSPPSDKTLVEYMRPLQQPRGLNMDLGVMSTFKTDMQELFTQRLPPIPFLVLSPGKDRLLQSPEHCVEYFVSQGAHVMILREEGHAVAETNAPLVAKCIEHFMKSV